jgi:hypothetical protein
MNQIHMVFENYFACLVSAAYSYYFSLMNPPTKRKLLVVLRPSVTRRRYIVRSLQRRK